MQTVSLQVVCGHWAHVHAAFSEVMLYISHTLCIQKTDPIYTSAVYVALFMQSSCCWQFPCLQ